MFSILKPKYNFYTWVFIFILLSIFPLKAFTEKSPLELMLVNVSINQQNAPDITRIYIDKKNACLFFPVATFDAMGLIIPSKLSTQLIQNNLYFCLEKYPGLTYKLNSYQLQLDLSILVQSFNEQVINDKSDQTQANSMFIRPENPGAFLNYNLSLEHTGDHDAAINNVSAFTELGLFNHFGVGSLQYLFQNTNNQTTATRLDTQWTQDQPENLASMRIGDSITSSASWSGATRFGGIQYATNFSTQPNLVTFPLPSIRGQAVLPSTVSLLVNNVASQKTAVKPGPFIINNVPAVTGAGSISIITENILGQQEIITLPYYSAPQLLKEGLVNFSYEAGFIRENYGLNSNDYGRALGTTTYSRGINNSLTLTGHAEVLKDQQTLGGSSQYLWGNLGVVSLSLAGSRASGREIGGLAAMGFSRQSRRLNYGIQSTFTTKDFTQVGFLSGQLAPSMVLQVFSGLNMGSYGSVSASYTHSEARSNFTALNSFAPSSSKLVTLSYNKNIFKSLFLNLSSIQDLYHSENSQISLMLSFALDSLHTVSANAQSQNNKMQYSEQLNKSLPLDGGYSYQLYSSQGDQQQTLATFMAKNDYGQYTATVSRFNDQMNYRAGIQGSLVHFAEVTELSQNLSNGSASFGLVKVPGIKNVRVYQENTLIGRTDEEGNLLIPNLIPYQKNQISIDPQDIPLDADISELEKNVFPYYRSGSIITFPIEKGESIIFHLKIGTSYVPTGALLMFKNHSDLLVGDQGTVYFDKVQNGLVEGDAYWKNQRCHFKLNVPGLYGNIPDLGEVICR
jgi:outer membrane usher protein